MNQLFPSRRVAGAVLLGMIVPACLVTTVIAQAPVTGGKVPADSATTSTKRNGDVVLDNKGKSIYDQQSGISKLTGNVRVYQLGEDFILYADELTYNEKTNQAIATGHLRVETRDSTITGKLMQANFNDKVIVILNDVVMKSHGKEDGIKASAPGKKPEKRGSDNRSLRQELTDKASSLTCERIDYNYQNREALVSGNIRMRQGKNFGTCEQVLFDEENNIAQLRGNVAFVNAEKRKIVGREVTVWIDENRLATDNNVTIQIPSKEDEKNDKKPASKKNFGPAPVLPEDWLKELSRPVAPAPTPVPVDGSETRTDDGPRLEEPRETLEAPTASAGATPTLDGAEVAAKPSPGATPR